MTDLDALLAAYATPPAPTPPTPGAAKVMAGAERGTFAFEDTTVATYAWGPTDGPVCLMMHGWGSKASDLAAFARALARQGCRVLALDAPAHGDSAGSGGGATTSMLQFTRLLRAFIGARGGIDVLLGHSVGAAAACYATAAGAPIDGPPAKARRLVLLGVPTNLATMTRNFLDAQAVPEQERAPFRALVEGTYAIRITDVDIARLANDLPRPILMVHDRTDEAAPFADAQRLADTLEVDVIVTEGLGHAGVLTAAGVLKAVRRFLAAP